MSSKSDDDQGLLGTWRDWIEAIAYDVIVLHHHRQLWSELTQAINQRATRSPTTWLDHYTNLYVDGQAMAIRRVIRPSGKDSISLGRLMEAIEAHPEPLNRDYFVARHANQEPYWLVKAKHEYDLQWSDGSGNLDIRRVRRDRGDLNQVATRVVELADKSIAHTTKNTPRSLTFSDLNEAIDHTAETFNKYVGLVGSAPYVTFVPSVLEWRSTFWQPLFDKPQWFGVIDERNR